MKSTLILLVILIGSFTFQACSNRSALKEKESAADKKEISFKAREYFLKGLYLQMEERYSEALVQFHKAQIFDTTSATISNSLAENYVKLNELDPALYHLNKARKLDPENLQTLNLMGEVYFRQRKDSLAINAYEKILAVDPYNEEARNFLFFLYEKNDNSVGKAKLYEELLQLYGKNETVLKQIVEVYLAQKDYDNALSYLNEWIELDSSNSVLYQQKGEILNRLDRPEEAITAYKKSLQLDPDNSGALNELGWLYFQNQRYKDIIDLYKPLLGNENDIAARLMTAEAYYRLEQPDLTRDLLLPLASKQNAPLGVYDLLGRVELEKKNYEDAAGYFKTVVDKDPKNRLGWLFLGFTYFDMDNQGAAEENFEDAVKQLPQDAALWSWYGISLQQQEKYRQAVGPFNRALILDPTDVNALSSLPVVYEELNMMAKSDSVYQLGLEQLPDNALLLNNYAYSLSERGLHLEKALEMSAKAIEAEPDNGAYLDTYGWILYKLKQYEEARDYILKSLDIRPNSAVVWEHLGDVYFKLNNLEKARESWQKAVELEPERASSQQRLDNNGF